MRLVHFIVSSAVLFSSVRASSFSATSDGSGWGASRWDGMEKGGAGRGTGHEADGEGLHVTGRAAGKGKAGWSAHKEGLATRGGEEQDEHQTGGGLPKMSKQNISS